MDWKTLARALTLANCGLYALGGAAFLLAGQWRLGAYSLLAGAINGVALL